MVTVATSPSRFALGASPKEWQSVKWLGSKARALLAPSEVSSGYRDIFRGLWTLRGTKANNQSFRVLLRVPRSASSHDTWSGNTYQMLQRNSRHAMVNGFGEVSKIDLTVKEYLGKVSGSSDTIWIEGKAFARNAKSNYQPPFGQLAIRQGIKKLAVGAFRAAKIAGVLAAALSVAANTYFFLSGQKGMPEALGSVVSDTVGGFLSGGFAALFSGGVLAIAAGLLGLTAGWPVLLLGFVSTAVGFGLFEAFFQAALADRIRHIVMRS